jgi:hypothetical protein
LTLNFSRRKVRHHDLPTYGALAGQLSKYDDETRELLADGYKQWLAVLRGGLLRMKRKGLLLETASPTVLARVLVAAHEGGSMMSSAYGKMWPDRDALTFALAHVRGFAARPEDREPRVGAGAPGARRA